MKPKIQVLLLSFLRLKMFLILKNKIKNEGGRKLKEQKEKNKIKRKENKGITLIALVITIVLNASAWS